MMAQLQQAIPDIIIRKHHKPPRLIPFAKILDLYCCPILEKAKPLLGTAPILLRSHTVTGWMESGKTTAGKIHAAYIKLNYGKEKTNVVLGNTLLDCIDLADEKPVQVFLVDDPITAMISSVMNVDNIRNVRAFCYIRNRLWQFSQKIKYCCVYYITQRWYLLPPTFRNATLLSFKTDYQDAKDNKLIDSYVGKYYHAWLREISRGIYAHQEDWAKNYFVVKAIGIKKASLADNPPIPTSDPVDTYSKVQHFDKEELTEMGMFKALQVVAVAYSRLYNKQVPTDDIFKLIRTDGFLIDSLFGRKVIEYVDKHGIDLVPMAKEFNIILPHKIYKKYESNIQLPTPAYEDIHGELPLDDYGLFTGNPKEENQ